MQITRTNKSPTEVTLRIVAEARDLEPIKRHVLGHFAEQVRIPGFRPGKAPLNLIEKNVDQKALQDEFMEHALNDLFRKAIQNQNIRPIGQPKVEIKKFVPFTMLEFEVETEALGDIKIADYKKIKLAKPKAEVTAQDVNEVLGSLRERSAERQEVKRPAKSGDEVIIDFAGKDAKGQPVAGADAKNYPLILGSKNFIPGFEEYLVGLKAGQDKEFSLTFPKDYGVAALQGKKVAFNVTINKVNELIEPKLDDAFAAKSGPFKTVAELKADIKKQLSLEKHQQADRQFEEQLVQEITAQSTVDVPKSLVDEQILRAEEEEKRNLTYRGQTWAEHLKEEGVTEEEHRERNRPNITQRVKAGLVLNEISQLEKIEVTPEELEIRMQILKGQYQDPQMQGELDKPENRDEIAGRIATEKTLAKLVSYDSK
jgi:trigger factor